MSRDSIRPSYRATYPYRILRYGRKMRDAISGGWFYECYRVDQWGFPRDARRPKAIDVLYADNSGPAAPVICQSAFPPRTI